MFIAAAGGSRIAMALMKTAAGKSTFFVAAHTFAEFYRDGRTTAREARLVKQWRPEVIPINEAEARLAGELLGRTGGSNSMDAIVVSTAALHRISEIYTTDRTDLVQLRNALEPPQKIEIVDVS